MPSSKGVIIISLILVIGLGALIFASVAPVFVIVTFWAALSVLLLGVLNWLIRGR